MINCHFDADGILRAEMGGLDPLLQSFLEKDVQSSENCTRPLIEYIDEVEGGRRPDFDGTGNAYHVEIRRGSVTIDNIWDETLRQASFSPAVFRACLVD